MCKFFFAKFFPKTLATSKKSITFAARLKRKNKEREFIDIMEIKLKKETA
jgi:hypothetical protein